jgi:hypothetical protein
MMSKNPLLIALQKVCKDCESGCLYTCDCHTCHVGQAISAHQKNNNASELSQEQKALIMTYVFDLIKMERRQGGLLHDTYEIVKKE